MDKQATDSIIHLILGERIQKAVYDSGIKLPESLDNKDIAVLLAHVYLGGLNDSYNYPDTSSLLINEDISALLSEPLILDRGF